jgi:hypothetical protein
MAQAGSCLTRAVQNGIVRPLREKEESMPTTNLFKEMMIEVSAALEWTVLNLEAESAEFDLTSGSGEIHTLIVTLHDDDLVEFDIPSAGVFDTEDDVPGDIAVLLLKRNMLLPVGAWALEEFTDDWAFSMVWTVPLEELQRLSNEALQANVTTLLEEVDEFDQMWEEEQLE